MATTVRHALRTQTAWDAMSAAEQSVYAGHYTTFAAWQTAQVRDLTASDEIAQLEIFDDWPAGYWDTGQASFKIDGWTTSATQYVKICAAPGHESRSRKTAGARIIRPDLGDSWTFTVEVTSDQYVEFADLYIGAMYNNGTSVGGVGLNVAFRRCFIEASYICVQYPKTQIYEACVIAGPETLFYAPDWSTPDTTIDNCVLVGRRPDTKIIRGGVTGTLVRNTVFLGVTGASMHFTAISSWSTGNVTSDTAAPDASFVATGIVAANEFVDSAGDDYHIQPASVLIGIGTNIYDSANPQVDIDGDPLPADGSFNVGVDYIPTASAPFVSTDLDLRWNSTATVVGNMSLQWSALNSVTGDLNAAWALLNSITGDIDAGWDIRQAVQADAALVFDILNRITADSTLSWHLLNAIGGDVVLDWDLRQNAQQELGVRWDIASTLASVSSDLAVHWDVLQAIQAAMESYWNTRNSLFSDAQMLWSLVTNTTGDMSLAWSLVQNLSADLEMPWSIRENIQQDVGLVWGLNSALQSVNADLNLSWDLRRAIWSALDTRWSLLQAINADAQLRWNVVDSVIADLQLNQDLLASVSADTDLRWDAIGITENSITFDWSIGGQAISSVSFIRINPEPRVFRRPESRVFHVHI